MTITERKPTLDTFKPIEVYNYIPLTIFQGHEKMKDVKVVGGKLKSLSGLEDTAEFFAETTAVGDKLLEQNPQIKNEIDLLDILSERWLRAKLAKNEGEASLLENQTIDKGRSIRQAMENVSFPQEMRDEIESAYEKLSQISNEKNVRVAVRSSGVAEDGKENSFSGIFETFLHQQGLEEVLDASKKCWASQFKEEAIIYRNEKRFDKAEKSLSESGDIEDAIFSSKNFSHSESKLAIGVQRMVDAETSGVAFSIDPASGAHIIHIEVNYGLGESVVSGSVNADSFEVDPRTMQVTSHKLGEKEIKTVYVKGGTEEVPVPEQDRKKFTISDDQVREIARRTQSIKEQDGGEVDVEFAFDISKKRYILQKRPETVASKKNPKVVEQGELSVPEKIAKNAEVILEAGKTGSPGSASGELLFADTLEEARLALQSEQYKGKDVVLATEMTAPAWVPLMKKFKFIITERGGRNCHAANVSRENGIPCLVGIGKKAMDSLKSSGAKEITADARNKKVYKGLLPLEKAGEDVDLRELEKNPIKTVLAFVMAMPDEAKKWHVLAELENKFKIGLLRMEFFLGEIGVHVNALIDYDKGKLNPDLRKEIEEKIVGYNSAKDYYMTKLTDGIASFTALFPKSDILLRFTDFKTDEYKDLVGGSEYERREDNAMMGDRGTGRYLRPQNREAFMWELEAIKRVREMGYKNLHVFFPMVRDVNELKEAKAMMGLRRGEDGLKVGMMAELPTNVLMLDELIDAGIDFVSIGSNDLLQFMLGVDRNNEELGKDPDYTEMNPAVLRAIRMIIRTCREREIEVGICGNGPSNIPEFTEFLVREGINSIAVAPDSYLPTHRLIRRVEKEIALKTN